MPDTDLTAARQAILAGRTADALRHVMADLLADIQRTKPGVARTQLISVYIQASKASVLRVEQAEQADSELTQALRVV